jgi:hypothetical protein
MMTRHFGLLSFPLKSVRENFFGVLAASVISLFSWIGARDPDFVAVSCGSRLSGFGRSSQVGQGQNRVRASRRIRIEHSKPAPSVTVAKP